MPVSMTMGWPASTCWIQTPTKPIERSISPPASPAARCGVSVATYRTSVKPSSFSSSSALHRICEHQPICRVHLRVVETSDDPWERVFDGVDVTPSLQLQVHMLKARPRTLPRRADRPDPLATLDTVPDP